MAKKKIVCIVGTRPEVIKMAPVILKVKAQPDAFDLRVVATAQHRELMDQALSVFAVTPDADFNLMQPNQTLTRTTCRALEGLAEYFAQFRPDIVLAQGDTTTVMAAAVACFYAQTAFGHVEAGLRTGNLYEPYPEEFNRRIAGLTARYHFAPTASAADNLLKEGIGEDQVFVTGNTGIDALLYALRHTQPPPKPLPDGAPYVLLTCHRREIFGHQIREVFEAVKAFALRHPEVHIWYPAHPNPEVQTPARDIFKAVPNVLITAPLGYIEFIHAMNGAKFILTDSGGVQEEAPSLGKPVLVLRDRTERPEGVLAGVCLLIGPHKEKIALHMERLWAEEAADPKAIQARNPYGDGCAADRIVDILMTGHCEPWTP